MRPRREEERMRLGAPVPLSEGAVVEFQNVELGTG
jgi:hypothetical protein